MSNVGKHGLIILTFGLYLGVGSSFTSWMKANMDYYFDGSYILLEQHYRTWDPHLCQWRIFDIIPDAFLYGPRDDLLTWMYKNFHDSLMRYLIDVHLYDEFVYFHDLYFYS